MSDQENQASRFARDMAANAEKMFKASQLIANTRDEDVNIGTTPKHLVMRRDKVELFHYEPMAEATAKTPVLLAYGLIGRYTMADLQPDRSLVRSLLSKGLDLWLIDWGQPGRTERWLTIDDYVDDYIDAAVDRIAQETGHDQVTLAWYLRGRCFHDLLRRLASREGEKSGHHHHADRFPRRRQGHGRPSRLSQHLDPQPRSGRHRQACRYLRRAPGRVHEFGVFDDDADALIDEIQCRPRRRRRRRGEIHEFSADGEVARGPSPSPRRSRKAVAEGSLPGESAGRWQLRPVRPPGRSEDHHRLPSSMSSRWTTISFRRTARVRLAQRSAARTTPKSRCPAAMWACSSRANRRESSARASPTGWSPATPIQ